MIIMGANTIPHCLKQNGMARILTPMMLFAVVIISLKDMFNLSFQRSTKNL